MMTKENKNFVIPFNKFFISILSFFVSLSFFFSCQIDINCRKPNPNELKDIKDMDYRDGKLAVLSSPQDVLSWCSAFVSIFEYSDGNLKFLKNVELSGKIAHDLVWVDKKILVLVSGSNGQVIDVVDPEEGKVIISLSLDLQNMEAIFSYGKSILVLPQLDTKIFFTEDIDEFISSKRGKYFTLNYLPKSGAIAETGGKKYIFIIGEKNNINVISQEGITQNINISEITTQQYQQQREDFISAVSSEVKPSPRLDPLVSNLIFNSKMFFRDGLLFIQANSEEMKGIFTYDVNCLVNKDETQNCSWFVPITSDRLNDIFVFSLPLDENLRLKIFPVIYGISADEKKQYSFISLLVFKERKFYLVDKKIIDTSPLYELVGYDVSQSDEDGINSDSGEKEGKSENKKDKSDNKYSDNKFTDNKFAGSNENNGNQNISESKIRKVLAVKMKFAFKKKGYDEIDFFEYKINLLLNQ
jgi:hypothetical protein